MATYTWDTDTGMYVLAADQSFSVSTDQSDYAPGTTADITAVGFTAGDTVEITAQVVEADGTLDTITFDTTVTIGIDGIATATMWIDPALYTNQNILLTATDLTAGVMATESFTDSVHFTPVDAVAPDGTNGMVITTAGAEATGTGTFPAFVEINSPANSTTESGYNPADPPVDNTGHSANFNHPIQVSNLDIETDSGQQYYVFRLDLNEPNDGTAGTAILQQLKLFYDSTGTATPDGNGEPSGANLLYDMDGNGDISITLADWSSGSGHGDYIFKIPVTEILAPDTYIYLYSTFTDATGGFEEWALGPNANPPPPPPHPDADLSLDKETLCTDGDNINLGNGLVNVKTDSAIIWEYTIQNVQPGTSAINMQLYDDKILGGTYIYDHTNAAWVTSHYINPNLVVTFTDNSVANTAVLDSGILTSGDIWVFDVAGTAVAGAYLNHNITAYVNTGTATGDDSLHTNDLLQAQWLSSYTGVDPEFVATKLTNGAADPDLIAGQAITWSYTVHNTGNVDLTDITLSDNNGGGTATPFDPSQVLVLYNGNYYNDGDLNHDGLLNPGETWDFTFSGTAAATTYTNIVTVNADSDIGGVVVPTDGCGDSLSTETTATSGYTGHAPGLSGLTKGYWGTHFTLWDVTTNDDKGTVDLNSYYGATTSKPAVTVLHPDGIDWNMDGKLDDSTLISSTGSTNGQVDISKAPNGGGDFGLLLGDLDHNGLPNDHLGLDGTPTDPTDIFFDLASAQALANSSVSGDARIILAGQAIAAQLNEYNEIATNGAPVDPTNNDASPTGLIEDAVRWLMGDKTYALSANGDSAINKSLSNDVTYSGSKIVTIIDDSSSSTSTMNDYTLSGGAITFKSAAMSSSDASWSTLVSTFTYHSQVDNADHTVYADGEGLKNALAAYNHGLTGTTAGLNVSADGKEVYWVAANGTISDVQANTSQAFWGILEDQNLIAHSQVIVGVVHDSATATY